MLHPQRLDIWALAIGGYLAEVTPHQHHAAALASCLKMVVSNNLVILLCVYCVPKIPKLGIHGYSNTQKSISAGNLAIFGHAMVCHFGTLALLKSRARKLHKSKSCVGVSCRMQELAQIALNPPRLMNPDFRCQKRLRSQKVACHEMMKSGDVCACVYLSLPWSSLELHLSCLAAVEG